MLSVAPVSIAPRVVPPVGSYVLLVDDHEPSLQRLNEVVRLSGHLCCTAKSGAEALICCEIRPPRVVVTDLSMPNLDGYGLARWLQARHPSVPIILMSGESFDPGSLGKLRRTFTAVLTKPVDLEPFLGLIDRLMPATANRKPAPGRP